MYELNVYFIGGASMWQQRPAEMEFIMRRRCRFLWPLRLRGSLIYRRLVPGRCGFQICRGGREIDRFENGTFVMMDGVMA